MLWSYRYVPFTAAALTLLLLYYIYDRTEGWAKAPSSFGIRTHKEDVAARASNATLGFERILVIGLPERSDKKDAMYMQSSLTGMHIDFIDGVKGETVIDKALPWGTDRNLIPDVNVGSTRAHLNAVRSLLEDQQQSLLVLEDDMDWDIRIRSQMIDFARGTRYLQNLSRTAATKSPYGDDWDILWLGHCGEIPPHNDDRRYIMSDDNTTAPLERITWYPELNKYPSHTRLVHKTGAPICTFAYAVSARGAQKVLLELGLFEGKKGFKGNPNAAFDNNLAWMCEEDYLNIKCMTVEPPLFFQHRPVGPWSKDSDIQDGDTENVREAGTTEVIVWSARINAEKLLIGEEDYETRWPE